MAVIKTPVATESAAVLHELIGEDATAVFESDPKFIDSEPTSGASSENVVLQRDTDDTEDSEEEEEEELDEEEEDEEEDEDEDEDEDDDEDDFDSGEEEEEEVGAIALRATGSTDLRGPVVNGDAALRMSSLAAVTSQYAANF